MDEQIIDQNDDLVMIFQTENGLQTVSLTPSQLARLNAPINKRTLVAEDQPIVIRDFREPPAKCVRISNNKIIQTPNTAWPVKQIIQEPKNYFNFKSTKINQIFDTNIIEKINPQPKNIQVRKSTNFVPLAPKPPNFNTVNKISLNNVISGKTSDENNLIFQGSNNKETVVYDPASNRKIIYRVVYPEDLNLCSPEEVKKKPVKAVKKKPKPVDANVQKDPILLSTTRSGRKVRPPKHISTDYKNFDNPASLSDKNLPFKFEPSLDMEDSHFHIGSKKRHSCPTCLKGYSSQRTLARHLHALPDHAIGDRAIKILEVYKSEIKTMMSSQTQTDFEVPKSQPIISNPIMKVNDTLPSQSVNEKKSSSNPTPKRRDERSLFTNLIRMLEHAPEENRVFVFVRQLTSLVIKLQRLLPCLMQKDPKSTSCTINEALGRLLNLDSGKYSLNMNAISCARMPLGKCSHSPSVQNANTAISNSAMNNPWASESQNKLCSHIIAEPENQVIPLPKWDNNNLWVNNDVTSTVLKDDAKNPNYQISNSVAWNNTDDTWIQKSNEDSNNARDDFITSSGNSIDKWAAPNPKPKWIPVPVLDPSPREMENEPKIRTPEWLQNDPDIIVNTTNIKDTINNVKTWSSNINEPILNNAHQQTWQNQSLDSEMGNSIEKNGISFACNEKIIHSGLVFNMKDQISKDLKQKVPQKVLHPEQVEHFNFNSSEFEMQIDASNIAFTGEDFESLKYTAETLPPFQKIDQGKKMQLPVENFNIISDDDKIHLDQNDSNLMEPSNFPITSNALELNLDNNSAITSINTNVESCTTVTISNGKTVRSSTLSDTELILPMSDSDSLTRTEPILSVGESSLDENRLNMSSSQSVLHLLDPLSSDCLSFTDTELRPSSQMPYSELLNYY